MKINPKKGANPENERPKQKMKHNHQYTRSKPSASVETCICGKFRFTENAGKSIVGQTTTDWKDISCQEAWDLTKAEKRVTPFAGRSATLKTGEIRCFFDDDTGIARYQFKLHNATT